MAGSDGRRSGDTTRGRRAALPARYDRRRGWPLAAAIAGVAGLVLAGLMLADVMPADRLLHPRRYAVTGSRRLSMEAYLVAAGHVLGADDRIGALTLPAGRGPVTVVAWHGTTDSIAVYLDPPTARVLDIAAQDNAITPRPLARTGQPADVVVARGRALAGTEVGTGAGMGAGTGAGAPPLATITWPSARVPDWSLDYADGTRIKVADDRPGATAARARDAGPGIASRHRAPLVLAGLALLLLVVAVSSRRRLRTKG